MDGYQELRPRPQSDLVPEPLLGRQPSRPDRHRGLFYKPRRLSHAGQEGPGAAGPQVFQANEEVTQVREFGAQATFSSRRVPSNRLKSISAAGHGAPNR